MKRLFIVALMKCSVSLFRGASVALIAFLLAGCLPATQNRADEEKEPHFMSGKNRASTMDYNGAMEAFEKAIEVNPRSAAAHFELACLCEKADPAAAIYHYESYLKLRPDAGNVDIVKQRIMTCKQELVVNVLPLALTQLQQKQFEQLTDENKKLTEQINRLNEDLDKWRAYAARLQGQTNAPAPSPAVRPMAMGQPTSASGARTGAAAPNTARTTSTNSALATRTHTIKAGETAGVIARKYGIKVDALLTANPRVDPHRLQIGQSIVIPAP